MTEEERKAISEKYYGYSKELACLMALFFKNKEVSPLNSVPILAVSVHMFEDALNQLMRLVKQEPISVIDSITEIHTSIAEGRIQGER